MSTTDLPRFLTLVADMRAAQKLFFRTHNKDVLLRAKQLEKEVDEALVKISGVKLTVSQEFAKALEEAPDGTIIPIPKQLWEKP